MLSRKFMRIFAYVVLVVMLLALIGIAIAIDTAPSGARTVAREATLENFEPIGGTDDGLVRAFLCQKCSLFLSGSWTIKQTERGIVATPRL